ncbi:NAD(P)-dependent oxidoreductase [Streptomyces sp. GMY02]|uniref:NAD-dependent epimerase/dehydratase family protein n=1 Tax=Streptomyces sp. GMY02 TaxID=1333528 RepID=UPI001C2C2FD9|nr:NAD(P)-dependent oxidoreductase [Streptomyces sp. GMY02]QXE35936.1 NAD(P)-dependent oxidoreductase [Streptomyces sp. GMY02]
MTDDRVLVLGGTGFVGREVCAAFAAAGRRVIAASRNPVPSPAPGNHPGVRALRLDLGAVPAARLAGLLDSEKPGTVVNCVGSIWGRTAQDMVPSIVAPTERLLEALALAAVRPRLVHLGSVLEYGPVAPGTTARGPARPDTPYGQAKLAATEAVLAAHAAGTVDALVLRIANVAGPGTPDISLLGQVAARLATWDGGPEPVVVELSPLRAHRDYVDVRDVADAVVAAAGTSLTGRCVDIGRGEAVPVRELVGLLVAVSGVPVRLVETVRDEPRGGGPASADWMRVDNGPAGELLGWRPRRSLEDAVRAYWEQYPRARATAI